MSILYNDLKKTWEEFQKDKKLKKTKMAKRIKLYLGGTNGHGHRPLCLIWGTSPGKTVFFSQYLSITKMNMVYTTLISKIHSNLSLALDPFTQQPLDLFSFFQLKAIIHDCFTYMTRKLRTYSDRKNISELYLMSHIET